MCSVEMLDLCECCDCPDCALSGTADRLVEEVEA